MLIENRVQKALILGNHCRVQNTTSFMTFVYSTTKQNTDSMDHYALKAHDQPRFSCLQKLFNTRNFCSVKFKCKSQCHKFFSKEGERYFIKGNICS